MDDAFPFDDDREAKKTTSLDAIQVLKISGQDARAVIKTLDGKKQLIKVGDSIGNSGTVIEIVKNRIVIEDKSDQQLATVVIRIVNGQQKIEKIRKAEEKSVPSHALHSSSSEKEVTGRTRK